jgi:hypothetical protein
MQVYSLLWEDGKAKLTTVQFVALVPAIELQIAALGRVHTLAI